MSSWQEELRKLDEELAAGQISADDYRVRRDHVLSSAVSSTPESEPAQRPPQDAGQPVAPAAPANASAGQPSGGEADKTQIVPGDAERTQAVGPWQSARPGGDADRTQIVPGVPPQAYAGGMPPRPAPPQGPPPPPPGYQHPGWGEEPAPWSGTDFPPLAPAANPDWIRQGPEVFEAGDRSNTGRILLITLAVVVVLAIAGGILYLTVFRNDETASPPPSQTSTPTQSVTTSKPPPTHGPLRIPDGRGAGPKTYTAAELEDANALPAPDLILLKEAGITEARSVIVGNGSSTMSLWSFAVPDAKTLEEKLTTDQQRFGFKETQAGQQGVQAYASTQQNAGREVYVLRAHYVSGGKVIRVEAFDEDEAKARNVFEAILKDQLELTPPE